MWYMHTCCMFVVNTKPVNRTELTTASSKSTKQAGRGNQQLAWHIASHSGLGVDMLHACASLLRWKAVAGLSSELKGWAPSQRQTWNCAFSHCQAVPVAGRTLCLHCCWQIPQRQQKTGWQIPAALIVVVVGVIWTMISHPHLLRTLRFGPTSPQLIIPSYSQWIRGDITCRLTQCT